MTPVLVILVGTSVVPVLKTLVLILNHPKYKNQVAMLYCTAVT